MPGIQAITNHALILFSGCLGVVFFMLVCCAVAWFVAVRMSARRGLKPRVVYGSYQQDSELRARYGRKKQNPGQSAGQNLDMTHI